MTILVIRIVSCTVCGIVAGIVVHIFYKDKPFFNFEGFEPRASHDTHPNLFLRFLFNLGRSIKATGLYFLLGVLLSALFQRYVPADKFAALFGKANEGKVFVCLVFPLRCPDKIYRRQTGSGI